MRKHTTKFLRILLITSALAFAVAPARAQANDEISPDLIRQVELEWEPVEKAIDYEFQFATSPEFEKPLYELKTKELKFRVNVLPGSYYYRVRAYDDHGRPGHWTDTHELNVNARPPILLWPDNGYIFVGNLPDSGIPLEWRTSGPGIRYLVEIKTEDEKGEFTKTLVKQEWDGTIFSFFPEQPGRYQWSVHTIGAAGDEPGVPWVFTVEGVVPHGVPIEPGITPKRVVRYVSPWWRNHWWAWLRYGQMQMGYSIVDQDLRASSDFTGFTGFTSGTVNWEWHDPVKWTGGGIPWVEGEVELDRETVLSESVILSRKYLRVGSWYDDWVSQWRFSPVIGYGSREIAIYQPRSSIEAVRSTTTLSDFVLGISVDHPLKPFLSVGGDIKVHLYSGGEGGFVPKGGTGDQFDPNSPRAGALSASPGLEIDGLTTMSLSPKMKIQGRLRYEKLSATWVPQFPLAPNSPDPSGLTSFSIHNFSFDISFGYHF